jgi:hypothetical protein
MVKVRNDWLGRYRLNCFSIAFGLNVKLWFHQREMGGSLIVFSIDMRLTRSLALARLLVVRPLVGKEISVETYVGRVFLY